MKSLARINLLLVLFLLFTLTVAGCGGDDDDNDSHPSDDDTIDDNATDDDEADDEADDDADDDAVPDDDTATDDDTAADDDTAVDDDVIDYTREPLAIATASSVFVDVGDEVTFSGVDSSDPNGSTLTYAWDFADGESASTSVATHAFDAVGTYRVVLTVTNTEDYTDESAVLVTVGEIPAEVGLLNGIAFHPNHYNNEIIEQGDKPKNGGLIYGFFTPSTSGIVDAILVNSTPYQPGQNGLQWCEVVPAEVVAGEPAILRCHSYDASFDAGDAIDLEVRSGATTLWNFTGTLPQPSLTPGYIAANVANEELVVHVRNDHDQALTITGLSINGTDVSAFIDVPEPVVPPDGSALIRLPQPDGVPFYAWTVFNVHSTDGRAEYTSGAGLRLFPQVFPVGDWNSSDNIWHDETELDLYLEVGINMFIYSPSDDNPPDLVLPQAEEKDFYLFTHQGNVFDPPNQYFLDFVAAYGDNPRILTNAVSGEGDLGGDAWDTLPEVQGHRALWGPEKPLWQYNACSFQFPAWGPLGDIGGMDHYCVWAPKCNYNWPLFYWDKIEVAGWYAEEAKRAAEPSPTWDWTQGLFNTMQINDWQIRCTTADEIRAQWYMVLSRGVKGVLWFYWKKDWGEDCPQEYTEGMARCARELALIKETMLEGEISLNGMFAAAADAEAAIDVAVTRGPASMVIFLNNLDYDLNLLTPFAWHEQQNIVVDVTPPAGFEPAQFLLADDGQTVELQWQKVGPQHWQFTLPSLKVAEAVLVVPEP